MTSPLPVKVPTREQWVRASDHLLCAAHEASYGLTYNSLGNLKWAYEQFIKAASALGLHLSATDEPAAGGFDLIAHLHRQRKFSEATFGPGTRTKGVIDHIRKELGEIEADPNDVSEWTDVILLALDGAWRAGFAPEEIAKAVDAKQTKNEGRTWPDWRTASPDHAIEHDRDEPAAQQPSDLVKRLLERSRYCDREIGSIYNEAAARIEALEAAELEQEQSDQAEQERTDTACFGVRTAAQPSEREAALVKALEFYAEEKRYGYDTDCCPERDNPGFHDPEVDLLSDDRGRRAREALAASLAKPDEGREDG